MTITKKPLIQRINNNADSLSPKQYQLAKFMLLNYRNMAFENASTLAKAAGVSESTVTRLAHTLGYSGSSDLQLAMKDLIKDHISSLERSSLAREDLEQNLFSKVFGIEKAIMDETLALLKPEIFEKAVNLLYNSSHILIVGTQPDSCAVEYALYLSIIRQKVKKIVNFNIEEYNDLKDIGKGCSALILSFPRYPERTQTIAKILKSKGVSLIGITDSHVSPIAALCDLLFTVPMKFITLVEPMSAVVALIHALIIGIYLKNPDQAKEEIKKYETLANFEKYYIHDDINIVDLI